MKAKKYLGQNFLVDKTALAKIASFLEITPKDKVIEIGPGHGELTEEILKHNPGSLSVIEKDSDLWPALLSRFENKKISLVKGDALELLADVAPKKGEWKIAGNIPYYITGHLLRIIGELQNPPSVAVFTVQKEVAERASALPPKMNLLSASLGYWGDIEMKDIIKKDSFRPIPKVDSAVIVIHRKKSRIKSASYYEVVHTLFRQPRKTVLNNLSEMTDLGKLKAESVLTKSKINPFLRPQDLSVDAILQIVKLIA